MPRVIAGSAGGRPLRAPSGQGTRPTADRVKEALFSTLGDLSGAIVLDLFAGSGALAIEALSRGADHAVLVEPDRRAAAVVRDNLRTAGVADAAAVVVTSAARFAAQPEGAPFDLVLVDPPYRLDVRELSDVLADLVARGGLAPGARVVIERDRRRDEAPFGFLVHDRDRTYGDTLLRYYRHRPEPADQGAPTT